MSDTIQPNVSLRSYSIRRFLRADSASRAIDVVAVEEPLDIRISFWTKQAQRTESLALAMRTPGHDRELVAGFLLSEGIVTTPEHILNIRHLGPGAGNEILAELAPDVDVDSWRLKRNTLLGSSCGLCGKAGLRQLIDVPDATAHEARIAPGVLFALPQQLAEHQQSFAQTGALHAAALVSPDGRFEQVFEDIGRHNATDKLFGWCLLAGRLPLAGNIVFLSSRSSFELVQKTAMASGSILATIGGPSSLAVETARTAGITLIGFLRDGRCNVYSGEWRIDSK